MAEKKIYHVDLDKVSTPFHGANVDIIIPYHGNYSGVTTLIKNLFTVYRTNPFRITVVDDASSNAEFGEDLTLLSKKPDLINLIRNKNQIGFGASVNLGVKSAKHPWIVVMHSDVVPETTNWLLNLGDAMLKLKEDGIKLVTARTNNPVNGDSRLQADKTLSDPDQIVDDGVPFYTALFHRDLFKVIGNLKEYPYAGYEDDEFAFRMKKKGLKQAICGNSWVHHEGQATINQMSDKVKRVIFEENRNRCIKDMC